ncbi:MAG: peptidase M20, partial [Acidovorax sp.]|nr:peptidase M20 [Acidovorax sp.]
MNARVPSQILQPALALERVGQAWDDDILRQLTEYIAIPAKSPTFAPDWAQLGLLDTVVRNAATWVEAQKVA